MKYLFLICLLTVVVYSSRANDFSKYRLECNKDGVIFNGKNEKIVTFSQLDCKDYHNFQVHADVAFWITQKKKIDDETSWITDIWKIDLKNTKKEKFSILKGGDIKISPTGDSALFLEDRQLKLINFNSNEQKTIIGPNDKGFNEGFTLLKWSSDGKKFWLGFENIGSWSQLGKIENGKLEWLAYHNSGDTDEELEPDKGWLITSNASFQYDVENQKEYEKKKEKTILTLVDVFSGKKIVLAEGLSNYFKPKFIDDKTLEYFIGKKRITITKKEIEDKLNTKK